jgi:DNA-binding transcriptional LysR family regulator
VLRLEASLGVKLFHRTTRQVSLTPDGERLYHRCERVLAEIEDLHADAAGTRTTATGLLRIDMPIVFGRRVVLPLLARLQQEHPELELDVRLQDGYVDLIKDGIDLAIRCRTPRCSCPRCGRPRCRSAPSTPRSACCRRACGSCWRPWRRPRDLRAWYDVRPRAASLHSEAS